MGMLRVGQPVAGETVVVSAAAGATGSVAGQIAKIKGCRAVGIAGGPQKCRTAVEIFGFDACVDYKTPEWPAQLAAACPDGINVFFDTVAGEVLDTCLMQMAVHGRIVFCGAISEYNNSAAPATGLKNYVQVLNRGLRWEAIRYHEHLDIVQAATRDLQGWIKSGRIKHSEDIVVGLENFYPAFMKLFSGANSGKVVVQVKEGETA
jgi:NADPH-dependent curcumin reductase CurA